MRILRAAKPITAWFDGIDVVTRTKGSPLPSPRAVILPSDRPRLDPRLVLLGIMVPALVGVLVSVTASPLATISFVVVLCTSALAITRLGVINGLLHTLVVSVFAESVTLGSITVGRLLTPVIALTIAGCWALTPWKPPRLPLFGWLPAAAYVTWVWTSGFWSIHFNAWAGSIGGLVLAVAYFAAFAMFVRTRVQAAALLRTYALTAAASGILALIQSQSGGRAVGLQGDPNIFALYEILAIPIAAMLARKARGAARWFYLATLVLDAAAVVVAESRGGLLTLAALILFMAGRGDFSSDHSTAKGRLRAFTVAVVAILIIAGAALLMGGRLSPTRASEDRGSGRLDIWRVAYTSWTEHPLLGIGAGNFQPESSRLLQETPGVELSPNNPLLTTGIKVHDVYLENLVELGPLGLLGWLALIGYPAREVVRRIGWRATDSPWTPIFPMLVGFASATIFLSITNNKILWIIIGLVAAMPRIEEASMGRDRTPGAP